MSALEKIRKHPGLLITIIGVAIVLFIIQLVQETGIPGYHPGTERETVVSVNKDRILYRDFDNLKNRNIDNMKRSTGRELTQSQTYSIYNSTLEQMIKNNIMSKEYDAVGMGVSSAEMYDLFMGDEPHEFVTSNFRDEQGNFNRDMVASYIQMLEEAPEEYRIQWAEFEDAIRENYLEGKFNDLLKASYFVPDKLAEKYYNNKNEKTSVDIVALRYSKITDSVVVSDKDKKKFYEENKYKYETDATRGIEYVVFDIKPSEKDQGDALNYVSELKDNFAATDDIVGFVNANSEMDRRYDSTWMGRKDVPVTIENVIFDEGNQPGFVYGPYFDQEAYNLVRIVDFQSRPDSLRASHILIPYVGAMYSEETVLTKEMAEQRADSIANVLKKNQKDTKLFGQLAGKFSSDKGSAEKEGDLDWFRDGMMVYDFNEFVVKNDVGKIGVVETPFGFHVIKVTGKTEKQPKARLAILSHNVNTSSKTYKDTYNRVNAFVTNNRTYDQFNAAVEAEGLVKRSQPRLTAATYQITGIENPRPIVRWAFDKKTDVGDVSSIFEFDDMFVVAVLTDAVEEGYAPLDKIAEQQKDQILNLKRGEIAVSKMKACGTDYDRMVSELGAETASFPDITMESRSLGNYGTDATIVGTVLGMKEGEVIGPVAGGISAFILKNVKHSPAPAASDLSSILREKRAQFDNKVLNSGVYNALRNKADIKDNRVNFF